MHRFANDQVRKLRDSRNWTQAELAARLTIRKGKIVTPNVIDKWETGKGNPNALSICYLAQVFDVRIGDLFEETGDE